MPGSSESAKPAYVVRGRIVDFNKDGVADLMVRAFDSDPGSHDDALGSATTDDEGRYEIGFERKAFAPGGKESGGPDIYIRVYGGEEKVLLAQSRFRSNAPKRADLGDFPIDLDPRHLRSGTVKGRVVMPSRAPAVGLPLRLYKIGFGGKDLIAGDAMTGTDGRYTIAYSLHDGASSLEVRAVDRMGRDVVLSKRIHDAGDVRVVDLVAPAKLQPAKPEFDRLSKDVATHIGAMGRLASARETRKQRDLTLLARSTGWDARLLALATKSERLAADKDFSFSSAVTYAFVRAGLPSDKTLLARVGPGVALEAVKSMETQGIVKLDKKDLQDFEARFADFSTKTLLEMAIPGSGSTYREFLKETGLSQPNQAVVAEALFRHGSGEAMWDAVKAGGLSAKEIGGLKTLGKLAFMSGFSLPMTMHLAGTLDTPEAVVARDLFETNRWEAEVYAAAGVDYARRKNPTADERKRLDSVLPASLLGSAKAGDKDAGRRATGYAAELARKVRISYSTQIVARRVQTDDPDRFGFGEARAATAQVLSKAAKKGFLLGRTQVTSFLSDKKNQAILSGLGEAQAAAVKENLKTLHRLWQMTPNDPAMHVLGSMRLTDAQAVAEIRRDRFTHLYLKAAKANGIGASEREAHRVHAKAQQITHATRSIVAMAKTAGGSF